jgi:hypothetical protein
MMIILTILLFGVWIYTIFDDSGYKGLTKICFGAFMVSLIITIIYNELDENKLIEQEKLVLAKKRIDQKQDSLLIIMEAEIDNYLEQKDTILVKESLKAFFHTSDSPSPYKNDGFIDDKELTYKEYWRVKRKEKLKKLEKIKEKSLFNKIFN